MLVKIVLLRGSIQTRMLFSALLREWSWIHRRLSGVESLRNVIVLLLSRVMRYYPVIDDDFKWERWWENHLMNKETELEKNLVKLSLLRFRFKNIPSHDMTWPDISQTVFCIFTMVIDDNLWVIFYFYLFRWWYSPKIYLLFVMIFQCSSRKMRWRSARSKWHFPKIPKTSQDIPCPNFPNYRHYPFPQDFVPKTSPKCLISMPQDSDDITLETDWEQYWYSHWWWYSPKVLAIVLMCEHLGVIGLFILMTSPGWWAQAL